MAALCDFWIATRLAHAQTKLLDCITSQLLKHGLLSSMEISVHAPHAAVGPTTRAIAAQEAPPDFKLYVMDISYFSGKLECYLRFKDVHFKREEPTLARLAAIGARCTGSAQVPLLEDLRPLRAGAGSSVWLRDTTPIIELLENDAMITTDENSVMPRSPLVRFAARYLEDYADESLWRLGMFYRWAPTVDARHLSNRFTYEFAAALPWPLSLVGSVAPRFVIASTLWFRQRMFSVEGEGIVTAEDYAEMENQYVQLLSLLETILRTRPYLLGSRPSLADYGFAGPFFRHLSHDPTPRKLMEQLAPNVFEWQARLWACKPKKLAAGAAFVDSLDDDVLALLRFAARDHNVYCQANVDALLQGRARFRHSPQDDVEPSSRPVVPYRAWSWKILRERFVELPLKPRAYLERVFREANAWDAMFGSHVTSRSQLRMRAGIYQAPAEGGCEPPFCRPDGETIIQEKWELNGVARHVFGLGA